jgi:hypothetical protein
MGNAQSHTYADRQRASWVRKSPHHPSTSNALRRTRSPTDEFMPELGYTPSQRGGQMHRAASALAGPIRAHPDESTGKHSPEVPNDKLMQGPTPAGMSRRPAQEETLSAQNNGHIKSGHSMPPSPPRDASNGHVRFEGEFIKGIHDHGHDRPRTPYPESGKRSHRI